MTQEDIDLFMESIDIGYTRCNVQPITGRWFMRERESVYGCGITSALINKNGLTDYMAMGDVKRLNAAESEFNLSAEFIDGFVHGFDNRPLYGGNLDDNTPDYKNGYRCGQEKREKWIFKG
jgi:hypothetical protein